MKKIFALFVIALIVTVGCAKEEIKEKWQSDEDCGKLSPELRDMCCAEVNKDKMHIMCVGEWKYNIEKAQCEFVCETVEEKDTKESAELANPASVFCERKGYTLEIRDEADGQAGYCIFPDGNECEEWAFYRGECGEKYQ